MIKTSRLSTSTRNSFRVTFEDGNHLDTDFNGSLDEAKQYYVGKKFNHGDTDAHPADKMVKAVSVTQLN